MFGLIKKIFGTAQDRLLRGYRKIVLQVNELEEDLQALSDDALSRKTNELRERLRAGAALDEILPEAYAVVKNACRRLIGSEIHVSGYNQKWDMIPYDVQILGAIAMHHGAIAEMQTGEGKTLTAALPLYLNALTGKPVHLVTVNDYLAKRDCEWIGGVFRYLGLTVSSLTNDIPPHERRAIYASDIVYGTASEFGFDYLRDNSMAQHKDEQCQRGHYFSIIDEVDSILIDEARTPLIISGPASNSRQMYDELKESVATLVRFQRDLCNRIATEAKKTLEGLGRLGESEEEKPKLSKEETLEEKEAYRKLWLVNKGTPRHKILRRLREDPLIREAVDHWDIYFHAEPNKEERAETLSELYMIVDERASEYELTDKGILKWSELHREKGHENDFVMLDLGHEYALIDDNCDLSEQDKLQKKIALREEDGSRKERAHNLRQLLRAHLLMERDVDYIVSEGKIVIIDENTGRPQPGRRFADGLHQAIEAKESVSIQGETQTYATITLQNYFRMYEKLSGMSGTAITEANEFKEIYKLEVLCIPTHLPCVREDSDDEIYMSEREKYNAILQEIGEIHSQERPILVGTESVEVSEKLSRILRQNRLPHTVLNAKNHAHEAEIIAEAGRLGAITVATNMAGRGTDIKLKEGVVARGGLHVVGTTRHHSRRIDRQLRGRCARLGDPGTSKFYVSFEDPLMRHFTSPRITSFLKRFRPPEGEAISAKMLNKSIETAQKRLEQRHYNIRKHTLEYDNVMNKQRSEIYSFRNELLHEENAFALAEELLGSLISHISQNFFVSREREDGWNPTGFRNWLMEHFPITFDPKEFDDDYLDREQIEERALQKVLFDLKQKLHHEAESIQKAQKEAKQLQPLDAHKVINEIVRSILVRHVDRLWQDHLLNIDHLRTEVSMRSVGQKDPLLEFKHEAFALFETFSVNLRLETAHALFKFTTLFTPPEPQKAELQKKIKLAKFAKSDALIEEPEFI